MGKTFDYQLLSTMVIQVVGETFRQIFNAEFTADPLSIEKDIIEYDGRMRLSPMEKFNAPAYIAAVNYFISEEHARRGAPAGTLAVFIRESMFDKLLKGFGRSVQQADDEAACMEVAGELCKLIADNLSKAVADAGFVPLSVSAPAVYLNNVPEGVAFNYDLYRKQELMFAFWKEKCVALEVCLGPLPARAH